MTLKASSVFVFLSVLLLIQNCNAYEFKVGGPKGSWTVPSDPNAAVYNQWAEKNRFHIGDTLLFVYDSNKDSVLHVTKEDYTSCNTASPLEKFTDGHTVVKFNQSGPHYFISGVSDNCNKNEKLHVIVMADRNKNYNGPTASPPSPSAKAPVPAASSPSPSEKVPSPAAAPAGEVSPSDSAPSDESTHSKNSAAHIVGSGVGMIGALFCSWIVSAI